MKFGLIGWGIASGNGGMNCDIVRLAPWVTHWLIPDHPKSENHQPYLDKVSHKNIVHCKLKGDEGKYKKFLEEVDAIIYVEHPCLREEFDIVIEAKKRGILVVGIPMWEWWPERKSWALATDILWAVTNFTARYLTSLSDVLYVHGWHHSWRNRVMGSKWGVNLEDFPYAHRTKAQRFVFINGNGGYKLRKASDIVFEAFSKPGAPPLTVYTQQLEILGNNPPKNLSLIDKNFSERGDVYRDGDVYLFPSYWEGLCHGIYEAQAVGGVVITTDHPPMNECGSEYLVPVTRLEQEDLSGKKIVKSVPDANFLYSLCCSLWNKDISKISEASRENIELNFNLSKTLDDMYRSFCGDGL